MSGRAATRRGVVTTGTLSILIRAAENHPDENLRREIWRILKEMLEESRPRHSRSDVESVIRSIEGTFLEPFLMDDRTVHVAVFLIRLAFSETGGQTRFRINSISTPDDRGGFVLTHNLSGYHVSRQLGGKHTRTPTSIWSFNPGTFSKTDSRREEFMKTRSPSKLRSKGWISEKGYRISILLDSNIAGAFQKWNKEKIDMKKLLDSSRMKPSGMKLSDLGFEGRISKNRFELNLAKPESMIKWGPRIRSCKGIELEIRFPLVDSENIVRCGIRNLSKYSGKVTAHLVLGETDLGGWIYNDFPHTPELGEELQEEINSWIPSSGWNKGKKQVSIDFPSKKPSNCRIVES